MRVFQSLDSMFNQKKKFYLKKGKNLHITWALTFYIYHQQICKKSPHVFVLPSFAHVLTQLVQNFCIAGESCYLRANPCKNSCSLCRKLTFAHAELGRRYCYSHVSRCLKRSIIGEHWTETKAFHLVCEYQRWAQYPLQHWTEPEYF